MVPTFVIFRNNLNRFWDFLTMVPMWVPVLVLSLFLSEAFLVAILSPKNVRFV